MKHWLLVAMSIGTGWLPGIIRTSSGQLAQAQVVRIAEIEIDARLVDEYKAALKEEIESSIAQEAGVLTLYAVSLKGHPERIRLLEVYRDEAAYKSHLQSSHFRKYKEQTAKMVKSLTLLETDPILLGSKQAAVAAER